MKSSLLRTFFEWALITSVLMSVGFFFWFWMNSRAARSTRADIAKMESNSVNNRTGWGRLMVECQVYARTNADLARFLTPAAQAAVPAPAATTKPGAK
jgi:hypothetical protein